MSTMSSARDSGRGADGLLTGRLEGANCRGPEKARRVRALLAERGLDDAELWAYGDSPDDEPLLDYADHGIRVDRTAIVSDLDTRCLTPAAR